MAKIRQLSPDMAGAAADACLKRIIAFRLTEIRSYMEGVYGGSADAIHDMRVSCRRLQALCKAFPAFFQRKRSKEFRRSLRKLLRGLGTVREYDVLIGYIVGGVEPAKYEQQVALGLLVGRYSLHRFHSHRSLHTVMRELDEKKKPPFHAERIGHFISSSGRPAVFRALLTETISLLFTRFVDASESVIDHPRLVDALHRLRIQGKPLRYTMELSTPFFGESFLNCYNEIKTAIELLGDIHDIDVALTRLKAYHDEIRLCNSAAEHAPSRLSGVGSGFLLKAIRALRARRGELFVSLSAMFGRWRKSRIQKTLLESMK